MELTNLIFTNTHGRHSRCGGGGGQGRVVDLLRGKSSSPSPTPLHKHWFKWGTSHLAAHYWRTSNTFVRINKFDKPEFRKKSRNFAIASVDQSARLENACFTFKHNHNWIPTKPTQCPAEQIKTLSNVALSLNFRF